MTNTLTTNIIRNVYNIGTNSCDAGTKYCSDGYALYFPCLKDITKGQDVCFDFYVADYGAKNAYDLAVANYNTTKPEDLEDLANLAGKETVDLRDVDAITLNLFGAFNCPYGSYSYPDNISSLQTEEYPVVYREDFGERHLCTLEVIKVNKENGEIIDGDDSDAYEFYSGTWIRLEAKDMKDYIFVGWDFLKDTDDEECPDDDWIEHLDTRTSLEFQITENMRVLAVYKKREVFSIISRSRTAYFTVDYKHTTYIISNSENEEMFDRIERGDGLIEVDKIENVLEGYHIVVNCIPNRIYNTNKMHEFCQWNDRTNERYNQCRDFIVGRDTLPYQDGNTIKLNAICEGSVPYVEPTYESLPYTDIVDEEGVYVTVIKSTDVPDYYYGDCEHILSTEEVYQKYIGEEGVLYFRFGTITMSSAGIEDGIKINIHAKADDYCELHVTVNGQTAVINVSTEEFKLYEVYFNKCDKSDITITSYGECYVDMVEVCEEKIIDRGKAQFCLPSEVTENLPSGPLSVNGAIMVDGKTYGLATTNIGTVNKLPKITINL